MSDTPAGWYPDVEVPGGERWWDGTMWTEHRRPAGGESSPFAAPGDTSPPYGTPPQYGSGAPPQYGTPPQYGSGAPPQYGTPPPYGSGAPPQYGTPVPSGYQAYGAGAPMQYPSSSKAGWALALSIGGLCCFAFAIAGLVMGRNEMQAIDEGRSDPTKRGMANAAFVVGIVMLALSAIGIVINLTVVQ